MQSFNNTRHDYEITLEPSSVVELCNDEEAGIAKIQYHVWPQTSNLAMFLPAVCCPLSSRRLQCTSRRLIPLPICQAAVPITGTCTASAGYTGGRPTCVKWPFDLRPVIALASAEESLSHNIG